MVDESVNNNLRDTAKERFVRLEEKVSDIFCNMSLLMETLSRKFKPFREVGGSKSMIGSEGKMRDNEDPKKESMKESEKAQPFSSSISLHNIYLKWK